MSKIKKFAAINIKKITGGKDPVYLIEELILKLGFDPEKCEKSRDSETVRWMLPVSDGQELEIIAEALKVPADTTVYLGLNVCIVPLRGASEMLIVALELADGLIGIKVSLVGHYLVLSASLGASGLSVEELEYHYKLIMAQQEWFRSTLIKELGLEEIP